MIKKVQTRVTAVFLAPEGIAACRRAVAWLQMYFPNKVSAPLIAKWLEFSLREQVEAIYEWARLGSLGQASAEALPKLENVIQGWPEKYARKFTSMEFAIKEGLETMQKAAAAGRAYAKALPISLMGQKMAAPAPAGGQGDEESKRDKVAAAAATAIGNLFLK